MGTPFIIDPASSALLLIDLQNNLIEHVVPPAIVPSLLERSAHLLAAARAKGLLVVHVIVAFRKGHLEVSRRNKVFGPLRESRMLAVGSKDAEIHSALRPNDEEPIVVKHRVGSFTGTDLETILRSNGVETIILGGIATGGAILSTVRHAFDMDYRIVVARDCCADMDVAIHDILLNKVFVQQTEVMTADAIVEALGAAD